MLVILLSNNHSAQNEVTQRQQLINHGSELVRAE
jgi:hypothetical protein